MVVFDCDEEEWFQRFREGKFWQAWHHMQRLALHQVATDALQVMWTRESFVRGTLRRQFKAIEQQGERE